MRGVGCNIESMARTKQKLLIKNVLLERVQVSFPGSLRVSDALRAGILLGGSEFVARDDLRELAQEQLRELGIDAKLISPRGVLPERMRIAALRR